MASDTFLWHDYETFGADPRSDRPAQFAAIRTDSALRPVGDPAVWYCRPPDDYLPDPEACLVTGLGPETAQRRGLAEHDFAARIHHLMSQPGTCSVGYNSIRFDDEVTRFLFYRNFFEPFGREWRNGNTRWDLIDLARAAYAFRPRGIDWPEHEPGKPSFRLADLAEANRLGHAKAHDALSDVQATIALAGLLRRHNPRLYDYGLRLRNKGFVRERLDVQAMRPVLHVSSKFPAERACVAMVAPLGVHPLNNNGIIAFDLSADPTPLLDQDVEAIRERVFTSAEDLPKGIERIPLKVIHVNRGPMIAPLSLLKTVDPSRFGMDPDQCLANLDRLRAGELRQKVEAVYDREWEGDQPVEEEALYQGGFLTDADRAIADRVRSTPPEHLADLGGQFRDPRMGPLLGRYRARNFPETLTAAERREWTAWCRRRLERPDRDGIPHYKARLARLAALRDEAPSDRQALLDELETHLRERCAALGLNLA